MCKPIYIEVVRSIPLECRKTLVNTDKNEIPELNEKIIQFCKEPRSVEEIKQLIGFDTTIDAVRRYIINPLLRDGKIKYTHAYKSFYRQRYIDARIEVTEQMLEEIKEKADTLTPARQKKILEYCKKPRGIKEIIKHLGTTNAGECVRELMAQGKLKYTIPHTPFSNKQKYINTEIEYKTFTEQDVVNYCDEPRTKREIEQHFNLTIAIRKTLIARLLASHLICYTEESERLGICDGNRRLIRNAKFI